MDIRVILTADPALLDAINNLASALRSKATTGTETAHSKHQVKVELPQAPGPDPEPTEEPKPKQTKKKPAAPDPEPSTGVAPSLERIQELAREKAQAGKKDGLKTALAKFEVGKISELAADDYLAFYNTIKAL